MNKSKIKKTIIKNKSIFQNIIEKLENPNFLKYVVDYTYDTNHNCTKDTCGGTCRCIIISNYKITDTRSQYLIDSLNLVNITNDELIEYCIDRTIKNSEISNKDNWKLEINSGYYGHEICGASLDPEVLNNLIQKFSDLDKLSDIEKIKSLLINEYGYLLPQLQNLQNFKVSIISPNIIKMNDCYMKKVSQKTLDYYKDYTLPIVICLKLTDDLYSIIDGYHRFFSSQKQNKQQIKIIEIY